MENNEWFCKLHENRPAFLNLSCNLKNISNSFGWFDLTEVEVYNIIKKLESHKSNGEDGISVKILKK